MVAAIKIVWKYIGKVAGKTLLAIPFTTMNDWKDCVICRYFPQARVESHDQEIHNMFLSNSGYSSVFHGYGFAFQPDENDEMYHVYIGYDLDQKIVSILVGKENDLY